MAAARAVAVRDDVVVKIQSPESSRRERRRTLAAQAVAAATGLFVVPDIVAFDDLRGEIVFARLPGVPLLQAPDDHAGNLVLVERAATILAAIHGGLEPEHPNPARPPVALHGDFGIRNLLYLPASDRIAVIDWANAEWIGSPADVGPPELDIAVFLTSLFHRRVFSAWPLAERYAVALRFLQQYATTAPWGLSGDTLAGIVAEITPGFNRLLRWKKGTFRALGFRHGTLDLKYFLRRLSRAGFTAPAVGVPPVTRD